MPQTSCADTKPLHTGTLRSGGSEEPRPSVTAWGRSNVSIDRTAPPGTTDATSSALRSKPCRTPSKNTSPTCSPTNSRERPTRRLSGNPAQQAHHDECAWHSSGDRRASPSSTLRPRHAWAARFLRRLYLMNPRKARIARPRTVLSNASCSFCLYRSLIAWTFGSSS